MDTIIQAEVANGQKFRRKNMHIMMKLPVLTNERMAAGVMSTGVLPAKIDDM